MKDGGPAFPIKGYFADASGALCGEVIAHAGMSLRDYFAAKAIASLGPLWMDSKPDEDALNVAREAYRIADAMLAEMAK